MSSNQENLEFKSVTSKISEIPTNRLWAGIAEENRYFEVNLSSIAEILIDRSNNLIYMRYVEDEESGELLPRVYYPLNPGVSVFVEYIPDWAPAYYKTPRIPFVILNPET